MSGLTVAASVIAEIYGFAFAKSMKKSFSTISLKYQTGIFCVLYNRENVHAVFGHYCFYFLYGAVPVNAYPQGLVIISDATLSGFTLSSITLVNFSSTISRDSSFTVAAAAHRMTLRR